jgi:hypothetical protein
MDLEPLEVLVLFSVGVLIVKFSFFDVPRFGCIFLGLQVVQKIELAVFCAFGSIRCVTFLLVPHYEAVKHLACLEGQLPVLINPPYNLALNWRT